jgi:hypothetical protein
VREGVEEMNDLEGRFDAALDLSRRIESTAIGTFKRRFQPSDEADVYVFGMVFRCLALFKGVIRCASELLADSSMVIARTMLEQVFVLRAIAHSSDSKTRKEMLLLLSKQWEDQRSKALNKMLTLPAADRSQRIEDGLLRNALAGIGDRERYNAEDWARRAGLHTWYSTAYTALSSHVHPSFYAIDEMFTRDSGGDLLLSARPHRDGLERTVLLAADLMVKALADLPEGCLLSAESDQIRQHDEEIQMAWRTMPDPPLEV